MSGGANESGGHDGVVGGDAPPCAVGATEAAAATMTAKDTETSDRMPQSPIDNPPAFHTPATLEK